MDSKADLSLALMHLLMKLSTSRSPFFLLLTEPLTTQLLSRNLLIDSFLPLVLLRKSLCLSYMPPQQTLTFLREQIGTATKRVL